MKLSDLTVPAFVRLRTDEELILRTQISIDNLIELEGDLEVRNVKGNRFEAVAFDEERALFEEAKTRFCKQFGA